MPPCVCEAAAVPVELFDVKARGLQENREGHGLALTRSLLDLCPSRRPSMNQALILVVHAGARNASSARWCPYTCSFSPLFKLLPRRWTTASSRRRRRGTATAAVFRRMGPRAAVPHRMCHPTIRLLLLAAVLHSLLALAPAQCVLVPGTAISQLTEPEAARLPH